MRYFLSMEVTISKGRINVYYQKYILNLLIKTSMLICISNDNSTEA